MPGQAFEALGDVEGARDHRIFVAKRLQLGLAGNSRSQCHGRRRILRHQFCQFVDLAIGHLQHATDVAQHAPRLQGAEGDDLRHLIAAVALLHIIDDPVAPVLTEIDIEVRHRDALGIEKPLEQQAEPDRVEIGNGQRIGHQRSRAGATARPDRNALGLGPLDEVRDDQEVARIIHAGDDIDLEGQPRAVVLIGHALGKAVDLEPVAEALLRLTAQFGGLIAFRSCSAGAGANREARQDRLSRGGAKRATLGDFDGGGQRLRDVGEQHRHFGAGLEAMIRGQLTAVGFGDQPSAGDAQQRVVGFVIVRGGEIRLVGRDQRETLCIGEIDQRAFRPPLLVDAVALQFDIEPVAEQSSQPVATQRRERGMIGIDGKRDRAFRPAGQGDQALGIILQPVELDVRGLMNRRFQERPGIQPHQVAVAGLARRQQHDPRRARRQGIAGIGILIAEIDRQFTADDRLDAVSSHLV